MDLYILRHAEAVEREKFKRVHDADRPLTENGIKKMKKIAQAMLHLGLEFDAILSSPYMRAKDTAQIVGEAFECKSIIKLTPHLVIAGSPADLVKQINEEYSGKGQILLVGHEPYLSNLISVLISGREDVFIKLRKSGICKLSVEKLRLGKCATLEWLMGPSQLFL